MSIPLKDCRIKLTPKIAAFLEAESRETGKDQKIIALEAGPAGLRNDFTITGPDRAHETGLPRARQAPHRRCPRAFF